MAHGAGTRERRAAGVILGIETSCDDTCAALVTADGEIRSNVIASQGLLHARYGGVVPEIASRRHLELVDAVIADALERAGARLDDVETVAVTHGPGLIGALLVGLSSAKALAAARRLAAGAGRPPARPRDRQHARPRARSSRRYLCLVASGGHTFLARVDEPARATRCSARRSTTPPARPSTRARGCSGSAIRAGRRSTGWRASGDPTAFDFPRSAPGELDFSFSGLKTVAALPPARRAGAPTGPDLAASYQRAIVDALAARTRGGARARGAGAAGDRRRRGGQLGAARGRGRAWACPSGCRRSSCAPTTRR